MSHVELAVLDEIPLAHQIICQQRELGNRVGLVPTMGALHEGHLSLVEAARRQSDFVVVTIFVNPTQFAAGEDLDRYPRTMEGDLELLRRKDVDLVFAPTVDQMYPSGCTTSVRAPEVATTLEGEHRPEHFEGVATVVLKLFQILPAHCAYFGLKDYQQCLVVRDMVRDLNVPIDLTFCPIIREDDGLAKSSRNRYLTPQERESATRLYGALQHARHLYKSGQNHPEKLERAVTDFLQQAVERIDYVAIRHADNLARMPQVTSESILLMAAQVGSTRLIDNGRLVEPKESPA